MRRVSALILICMTMLALLGFSRPSVRPAHAAVITITEFRDIDTGNCPTTCSLREAVALASDGDTLLPFTNGTITLTRGEIQIRHNITLSGLSGGRLTIDGGGPNRILVVNSGTTVIFSNLTLQNGKFDEGGAIGNGGTLTVRRSELINNTASNRGGAIYNRGTLTIQDSTVDNNTAYYGGGLHNEGTATIINSTFTQNKALGINQYPTLIPGPSATQPTPALFTNTPAPESAPNFNLSVGDGGGILNDINATLTIRNSTIARNSAAHFGGGVFNYGALLLTSTIIAGNTGLYHPADLIGVFNSQGHNLIQDQTEAQGFVASDQITLDPLLGALDSSGGSTTPFIPIAANSPAHSKGDCSLVAADQRGYPRGTPCDVGAYEIGDFATATFTASPTLTKTPTVTQTSTPTLTPTATEPTYPVDTVGVYDRSTGTFSLRMSNTGGPADITVQVGDRSTYPVVGDWDGDGYDTVGVYYQALGVFALYDSNLQNAPIARAFVFGNPNDVPLSGRWVRALQADPIGQLGRAHDGVGVFRPSNGLIYLISAWPQPPNYAVYADYTIVLGNPGWNGLAGRWIKGALDTAAVYEPDLTHFYMTSLSCEGTPPGRDVFCLQFSTNDTYFGAPRDLPVKGDWGGTGQDGIGVFRSGTFFLRYDFPIGSKTQSGYDLSVPFGSPGNIPVGGHWKPITNSAPLVIVPATAKPLPTDSSHHFD